MDISSSRFSRTFLVIFSEWRVMALIAAYSYIGGDGDVVGMLLLAWSPSVPVGSLDASWDVDVVGWIRTAL